MEVKKYTKRPPTIDAVQYSKDKFDELLKNYWIDGLDVNGVFIDTSHGRIYVEEGNFIIRNYGENFNFEKKTMIEEHFNQMYMEV